MTPCAVYDHCHLDISWYRQGTNSSRMVSIDVLMTKQLCMTQQGQQAPAPPPSMGPYGGRGCGIDNSCATLPA